MNAIIDYLTFSIKPDPTIENPGQLDKDFIFRFLNLDNDFVDIGRKGYYEHCYTSNDISIYEPYEDTAARQGWCVRFSGSGCRYYEQIQKDGEFINFWRDFFIRLRNLNCQGYSVNVSRLDIATDDYDGILDLESISRSANSREFHNFALLTNRVIMIF